MRRLRRHGLFRGAAVLALGTGIGQAVVLAGSPFLTRLYEPEQLGSLAVYASILSILTVVASLRYQLAIPLPEDEEVATDLLVLSVVVAIGFTGLIGALFFLLNDYIATWTNSDVLDRFFWLFPLSLLGASFYQALNYWVIRTEIFPLLARTRVTQSFGMVGAQIGFGASDVGTVGLLIGDALGRGMGSGALSLSIWSSVWPRVRLRSLATLKVAAARYRRFPFLSTWSGLLNSLGLFAPPLLIAGLFGARAAGFFALGQRLIAVPVTLVSMSVSQAFFGRAAHVARRSSAELKQLMDSTARRLFIFGLVPSLVILITGPALFGWVFGDSWREAGVLTQLLIPSFLLQFAIVPLSQTLNILERQDLQLLWDMFRLAAVVGVLVAGSRLGLGLRGTVGAYALVSGLAYGTLFLISRASVDKVSMSR